MTLRVALLLAAAGSAHAATCTTGTATVAQQVRAAAQSVVASNPELARALADAGNRTPLDISAVRTVERRGTLQQCQGMLTITLPAAVAARFSEPGAGFVLNPAGLRAQPTGLAGPVNYSVQPSDDGKAAWVEVRSLSALGTALGFALAAVAGPGPAPAAAAPPPPAPGPVLAAAPPMEPAPPPVRRCPGLDLSTVEGRRTCAEQEAEDAEAELERVFAAALAEENPTSQARMRTNQAQWKAATFAKCRGVLQPALCRRDEARARIDLLK